MKPLDLALRDEWFNLAEIKEPAIYKYAPDYLERDIKILIVADV